MSPQRLPSDRYPWWVKLTLLGSKTRQSQWFWFSFEIFVAIVLIYLALTETNLTGRIVQAVAAFWAVLLAAASFATIRWMDEHGEWGR